MADYLSTLATILAAGIIAQLIKILIIVFKHKEKFKLQDLIVTGGMPSSHSALVSSLVTILALTEGSTSAFFISVVLAAIVIRDAMGVRRTVGEEGRILHKIIESSKLKIKESHYSLGHTPMEVLTGIIIGVLSAFIIYFIGV